jgi:DNA-binding response OmpR family regulator
MARILVIDDDRAVGMAIEAALVHQGFQVHVVNDGPAGLAIVQSENFDLLIVDVFMPGMDGLETIRLVHRQRPHLPIVVMSGLSFRSGPGSAPDFLSMATKLGAVASLQKPFRPRELLAVIAQCLETSVRQDASGSQAALSSSNDAAGS